DDVPDINAVVRVCFHFWKMQPVEICGEFGYKTMTDLNASEISPWEAWLTIKQLKQPQEPANLEQSVTAPTKIKPKQAEWRAFWEHAEQLGLSEDRVYEMLGVSAVVEWTDQGKTLDEAIEVISGKLAQPPKSETKTPVPPATEPKGARAKPAKAQPVPVIDVTPEPTKEVTGEGFNIDMDWLKEALAKIKWNEATAWSFVTSQYKVDGSGTFPQTLNRLTREQAEEFVNEINKRLEKQKPLF
ncbi:unnamed protein product, partial [marine sediment metagenome]